MSANPSQTDPSQLWCLHGNLQTPAVWNPLKLYLQQHRPDLQIYSENLWETLDHSCEDWAAQFCRRVQSQGQARRVLLGYSLGGRLGFHALLHQPSLWAGAVIVAADPGMSEGRAAQLDRDRVWANRFFTEPLPPVMADWNRLPLFGGQPGPDCDISPYRRAIATAFVRYSKGKQADLRSHLQQLGNHPQAPPILYVTGNDDTKYEAIGQELAQLCPTLRLAVIPAANHRAPWNNPSAFHLIILTFLNQISKDYSRPPYVL